MSDDRSRLVYSTEQDVPKTKKDTNIAAPAGPASANRLVIRLDRKGRGGKSVTLIEGLPMPMKETELLLKQLKARLGAGGAMKDSCLELQGEHCEAVMTILQGMGLKPKRSGG
jgi:translation initiation factor 1